MAALALTWICTHCTFLNEDGDMCQMCTGVRSFQSDADMERIPGTPLRVRRPSALSPQFSELSVAALHRLYGNDVMSGGLVSGPPPGRHDSTSLRLVQWNLNSLMYGLSMSLGPAVASQRVATLLLDLDPDVIVLQEFGSTRWSRRKSSIQSYPGLALLEEALKTAGFELSVSPNAFPTLAASRLPASSPSTGRMLSRDRGVIRVVVRSRDGDVSINGTHLDAYDATSRIAEAATLLGDADAEPALPAMFCADMNQLRERDYTPEEWGWISEGRAKLDSPPSDGVSEMWEKAGFRCCFDESNAARNWPKDNPPPPSHWTGTNIDHTYGRGIECIGVFVIPSLLSDHLPVLSDWIIRTHGGAKPGHEASSSDKAQEPKSD